MIVWGVILCAGFLFAGRKNALAMAHRHSKIPTNKPRHERIVLKDDMYAEIF
jgi:hypothetical protein